jgi:hypothetical protein
MAESYHNPVEIACSGRLDFRFPNADCKMQFAGVGSQNVPQVRLGTTQKLGDA